MVTLKGTVNFSDLEGGVWTFVANDGNQYQIDGGDDRLLKNGQKATISGEIDSDMMGIGMMGDILKVKSYVLED